MKLLRILVQVLAVVKEFRQLPHGGAVYITLAQAKVRTNAVDNFFFVCLVIMKRQAEIIQTSLRQPLQNNLQSGGLLGDEQNLLSLSQCLRDNIGNGLTLAGTRGALHHKAHAKL